MSKKRVAVVFGGVSSEHDISLMSAKHIIDSIPKDKYEVVQIGITKNGRWLRFFGNTEMIVNGRWEWERDNVPCVLSPDAIDKGFICFDTDKNVTILKVDCIFPALHGKNGEDGTIQGLFELAQIPYVGCDLISSANCMDKQLTHIILDNAGIHTAKYLTINIFDKDSIDDFCTKAIGTLGFPMFVKPANSGSSVGVTKAHNLSELKDAIKLAFAYDKKVVVEQMIEGIECECAVMGNNEPFASTIGEIEPANEIYDFEAKYQSKESNLYIPARFSENIIDQIRATAIKAYKAIGCKGLARVDFFLCPDDNIYLNEINTLPGFTHISMYPKLMEHYGMTQSEIMDKLINLAIERAEQSHD